MSYVIHRAEYYNTTGAAVQWTIDIIDTTIDEGQTLNFQTDKSPEIRYTGLPQDLKPGIYPTTFAVRMNIRHSSKVVNGITMGQNNSFVTGLETANEGRYLLKLYKDDVHVFTGVILPDQCSYEDQASPYYLTIQAADGLYRLSTENYVSEVGQIEYHTLTSDATDLTEFSSTPLTPVPTGTEWILIEHFSEQHAEANPPGTFSSRRTTYARYEQYSIESPGTGWVDQGNHLWAKELTYSNETIVDEADKYHLLRDIDDTPFRQLSEYIRRAFSLMPTKDEYGAECMYDIVNTWYETSMHTLTGDPFTMIQWSERKFAIGKKWSDVIGEILRHFYCRLYYSDGRYHIEQISERANASFDRHCYDFEGTFIETETVNLDLSYTGLGIKPETGGSFKSLAPLKNVKVTVKLGSNNLLEPVGWTYNNQGSRYLGRVIKTEADTRFLIDIGAEIGAIFDLGTLFSLGSSGSQLTALNTIIVTRVRVTNTSTAVTYHLTPESQDNHAESTWETDEVNGYFERTKTLNGVDFPEYKVTGVYAFRTLTDDLPGDVGQSFDVYVSVNITIAFALTAAQNMWSQIANGYNPFYKILTKSMTTVDADEEPVNSNQEKVYEVVNSLSNSLSVEMEGKFCDKSVGDDAIMIHSETGALEKWQNSYQWNIDGVSEGAVELLQLLCQEIMSLRTAPRRLYSGGFMTTLMSTQNRINRGGYLYLPLNVTIDTDYDRIAGEFVHLERDTPPSADVIEIADQGGGPGTVGVFVDPDAPGEDPDLPILFETNEVIAASSTITEVDIINTLGAHIANGELVKIISLTDPSIYKIVTLTQEILPGDTVMYFTSTLFPQELPDRSLIVLADDTIPADICVPHDITIHGFTGTDYDFPDHYHVPSPTLTTAQIINKRIQVYRNGNLMTFSPTAVGSDQWDIDVIDNAITFPIGFDGERLDIKAKCGKQ